MSETPRADSPAPLALPWGEIDTVLLDMDGTLLDLNFDTRFWKEHFPQRYVELSGLSTDEARARLEARFEGLKGQLAWYCLDDWHRALAPDCRDELDLVALKRELAQHICYRHGVPDFLERLGAAGKQRVLVTNAHPASVDLKFEHVDLPRRLDRIFNAHEIGAAKESPRFWEQLDRQLHFDPDRTLLVDDNLVALAAAEDFGIRHLRAITRPNSQGEPMDTAPFVALDDFLGATRELTTD
ncbi:HAD-IA family hydrolase [Guyparkeria hydrothermalis]|uniref:HAD-IA family hydrolase n=1 Tax=Guyparkeria hydrothermalis TaxID=923 RepID=UPI00202121CC|nr:HAD-IA family hydrolase [Guyparkeria hydrothermalis]MCL7745176.1 HAD-IA family hydrolase [Guyparkeria hydrothermalis]